MTEIVKYERPAIEGEVLPPEAWHERVMRDALYCFDTPPQTPVEAFEYANLIYRGIERASGAAPNAKEGTIVDRIPPTRTWHPDQLMRRMGYTANPDTCRHYRKAYTPGSGWSCRDCGEPNLTQKCRLAL